MGWCGSGHLDPFRSDEVQVANFLADEFRGGKKYRTLNVYRSALSSTLPPLHDGTPVGQSVLVRRLLQGAYHEQPPQPRYLHTWSVRVVTDHIRSMGDNDRLSKIQPAQK